MRLTASASVACHPAIRANVCGFAILVCPHGHAMISYVLHEIFGQPHDDQPLSGRHYARKKYLCAGRGVHPVFGLALYCMRVQK